jgi:acetate kinase
MKVLVLNGGSSSLKGLLCEVPGEPLPSRAPLPLWEARVDWGRQPGFADIRIKAGTGALDERRVAIDSPEAVLSPVLHALWEGPAKVVGGPAEIDAAGHRIVHGGETLREPVRVTPAVKAAIAGLVEFAPEHNRLELDAIEAVERVLGDRLPQIAVFDTGFHATLPLAAAVYAGPYEWLDQGIRRYGFHGISHRYVSRRAAEILGRDLASLRLVTCHLGNGCSLAAVEGGRSVDTTMGMTPLEGLMMGTRSGSIDPGILIFLLRRDGLTAGQLDRMLNRESGLKGLSGVSADMREILAAIERGNARAKLAFDVFTHRLCREMGGMAASLGGVDAFVFTAGIGENCPPLREIVCRQLGFLGLTLDAEKNARAPLDEDIAARDSAVRVLVIHTDEDWEIACECYRTLMVP